MLEGVHRILVFPYCRRQGGRTLLKVQTNKPSSCVISKGQGAEHPQSLFIASIVKVESLDQDFCEAGIRCCTAQSQMLWIWCLVWIYSFR